MLLQASWWEGLVPAHWWVQPGLVPLVGRVLSGVVLIRQLWAPENFINSLSADGWGCAPVLLFGLRHPSTGACRLLGGARSWWEDGYLQEGPCQWVLSKTLAASVFVSAVNHSHPLPPQKALKYEQVSLAQALMSHCFLALGPGMFKILY